eukprot:TRINITY_DN11493_c0_g1_i1.p1 TRINITY_DN11493_c0_g1~~TRINITY_DN11493_c0_g1_i1.p1  ORF type:complete len:1561 (-),score=304.57 TRINITY_DN11493_c0_g1_i1:276-4292(-)
MGVRTVIAADLDQDGFLDLVVASKDDNSVTWYQNDGESNFMKIAIDSKADGAYSLVAVDVDKDGFLDVVAAANAEGKLPENGEGGMVSFYRNGVGGDGKLGSFTKVSVTAGNTSGENDFDWFVLSVWAGDLDMDGDVDIASASFSLLHQGGISWYENIDGQGNSWSRHKIYVTPSAKTGHYVYGADMDGDGDTDLVAVTNGDNKVQILTAKTSCDDFKNNPRASCCRSDQYWDGGTCASCASGRFLDSTTMTCLNCSSSCPRPGLAWQPSTCHSMPSCESTSTAIVGCTCGPEQFLDGSVGICVACPEGHVTKENPTRTVADFVMVEKKFLDQTKYLISDMSWFGFNKSRCIIPACSRGEAFDMDLKECKPCSAGTYSWGGSVTSCERCLAGSRCAGPTDPVPCQAGSYSPAGSSTCSAAPEGFYAPTAGLAAPLPCPPGSFSSQAGRDQCQTCSVGTYSALPGQTACAPCGEGKQYPSLWTTMKKVESMGQSKHSYHEGANSKAFCTCDVGSRLVAEQCVNCSAGMSCPGMGEVEIMSGFYADTDFLIFSCSRSTYCKGGEAGDTCARGRTGIACAECLPGYAPSSNGECKECAGSDLMPLVLCAVLSVVLLGLFYAFVGRKGNEREGHATLLVITSVSLLTAVVQQTSVIAQIEMVFEEPLLSFFNIFSILVFDIEIFNLECFTHMTPLSDFIVRVFFILIGMAVICFFHVVWVLLIRRGEFGQHMHVLTNVLGFFAMAFYIAVTSTVLGPWQCKENPFPNTLWTARKSESVVCWQSDVHYGMLVVSSIGFLVPLAFLSYAFLAVRKFPKQMAQGNASFLKSHRFLFSKYSSDRYWCTLFYLLRSLFLSIAPVIPNLVLQILLMQGIMIAQLVFTLHWKPYRNYECTFLEGASTVGLLCMLGLCPFFSAPSSDITMIASWLCFTLVIIVVVALAIGVMVATRRRIQQKKRKPFQFFLCHHKAGAGSFCRLLKMQLQTTPGIRGNVFIDSDDLRNLDMLFDYVGSQSETIVVLASKELFFRPWCMGELVTAKANGVKLIKVVFPDFVPYSKDFIDHYAEHVPGVSQLTPEGIDLHMVQDMLQWMQDQDTITLPEKLTEDVMTNLCTSIVKNSFGCISEGAATAQELKSKAVIFVDHANMEAVSASYILAKLVAPHFAHDPAMMPKVLEAGQALCEGTEVVLIVCTNGAFQQSAFLRLLIDADRFGLMHLPILASEGFRFPTGQFLQEHLPLAASLSEDPRGVLVIIESVFKAIAVVFQPEQYSSTDALLATKAAEIAERMVKPTQLGQISRISKHTGGAAASEIGNDNDMRPSANDATAIADHDGLHGKELLVTELF